MKMNYYLSHKNRNVQNFLLIAKIYTVFACETMKKIHALLRLLRELRGVKRSQGESRGVKGIQGESRGAKEI